MKQFSSWIDWKTGAMDRDKDVGELAWLKIDNKFVFDMLNL